jgi:ribosomal protein S18 acetylase RimI-like enzyme
MRLEYVKAQEDDSLLLIQIYNKSFYDDYIRYSECPAYGRTEKQMQQSIKNIPKEIIYCDDTPVGVISVQNKGNGEYYLGCLCVMPEYQGKGIGTQAFKHMLLSHPDWRKITLLTPVDKSENVKFYTEKCGFNIGEIIMDGKVEVISFYMER